MHLPEFSWSVIQIHLVHTFTILVDAAVVAGSTTVLVVVVAAGVGRLRHLQPAEAPSSPYRLTQTGIVFGALCRFANGVPYDHSDVDHLPVPVGNQLVEMERLPFGRRELIDGRTDPVPIGTLVELPKWKEEDDEGMETDVMLLPQVKTYVILADVSTDHLAREDLVPCGSSGRCGAERCICSRDFSADCSDRPERFIVSTSIRPQTSGTYEVLLRISTLSEVSKPRYRPARLVAYLVMVSVVAGSVIVRTSVVEVDSTVMVLLWSAFRSMTSQYGLPDGSGGLRRSRRRELKLGRAEA